MQLVASFKNLRTTALSVLQDISNDLIQRGKGEGSSETRQGFVESCSPILTPQVESSVSFISSNPFVNELIQIDHDFIFVNAKKIGDSRRKVLDGVGNGITRIRAAYS